MGNPAVRFAAHAIFSVGVPDVSEALAGSVGLGGTVVLTPQRDAGTGTLVAHLRDPAGTLVVVAGPR